MICVNCGKEIDIVNLKAKKIDFGQNIKICVNCITNLCSRRKIVYNDFDDRLVIRERLFNEHRTIVILLNNLVKKGHREFREIIGLDVQSGGIVKIVDENGKDYGYHTNSEYISRLEIDDVIKAPFKFVEDTHCLNVWRIVGECELKGKTEWPTLRTKYRKTHFFDVCIEFGDVIDFAEETDKSFYCLTRFTGSNIIHKNNKLYLQMGRKRVLIDKQIQSSFVKEGTFFRGIVLLYVANNNGKSKFIAKHMDYEWKKRQRGAVSSAKVKTSKNRAIVKNDFERVTYDPKEYYVALEKAQTELTVDEIINIQNDLKPCEVITSEKYQEKILNNLISERIWRI